MVNHTHDSMTKAYDRVLTALTYIHGPMINDWVNNQEKNLIARTNTTRPNHVREDDEVLWTEFETVLLRYCRNVRPTWVKFQQQRH